MPPTPYPYKPWMLSAMAPQGQLRADEFNALTQRKSSEMRNALAVQQLEDARARSKESAAIERERLSQMAEQFKAKKGWRGEDVEWRTDRATKADARQVAQDLRQKELDRKSAADWNRAREAVPNPEYDRQMLKWRGPAALEEQGEPAPPWEGVPYAMPVPPEPRQGPKEMSPGEPWGVSPTVQRRELGGVQRKMLLDLQLGEAREEKKERAVQEQVRQKQIEGVRDYMDSLSPVMREQFEAIRGLSSIIGIETFNLMSPEVRNEHLVKIGLLHPEQDFPEEDPLAQADMMVRTMRSDRYKHNLELLREMFKDIDIAIVKKKGRVDRDHTQDIANKMNQLIPHLQKNMSRAEQATFVQGMLDGSEATDPDTGETDYVLKRLFPRAFEIDVVKEDGSKYAQKIRAGLGTALKIKVDTFKEPGFFKSFFGGLGSAYNAIVVKPLYSAAKKMHEWGIAPPFPAALGGGGPGPPVGEGSLWESRGILNLERLGRTQIKPGIGREPRRGMTLRDGAIRKQLNNR